MRLGPPSAAVWLLDSGEIPKSVRAAESTPVSHPAPGLKGGRSPHKRHAETRKPGHLDQFSTLFPLLPFLTAQTPSFSPCHVWGDGGTGDPPLVTVVKPLERATPRQKVRKKGA